MKAKEVKRGQVVRLDGGIWKIVNIDHITPGNWRAMYQMKLKHLKKGNLIERRFSPGDVLDVAFLESRDMEFLYRDGTGFCFMNSGTYEQMTLSEDTVGEAEQYLKLNASARVHFLDGEPVGVDLPASVILEVTDTEPGVKGDTVSNVQKPATLETGLVVSVPLHIRKGDRVKVDTRTGGFLERSNQ